jgi:hypothetical protein
MTSNTNNNSGQSKILVQLYDLLLCLEDDIMAIQDKLSIIGYSN